jgi:hypothetical protein
MSINVIRKKKRGRPATGQAPISALRLPPALSSAIDEWARQQSGKLSRSEAIRRLLELALHIKGKTPYGVKHVKHENRLSGGQIRAARALLKWSAAELARQASLGVNTIGRAEVADGATALTMANEVAIRRALEGAGIEFIDNDGKGPGVRLRRLTEKKV